MVAVKGYVGPQTASDAGSVALRQDKTGALVVPPSWLEYALRGQLFAGAIPVAGQAPGTAIGTTAFMTLANPSGSGVGLAIVQAMLSYVSGTLGIGVMNYLVHNATLPIVAPSGGTAITPVNMLTSITTASVANCRFNNTVPAAGNPIRVLANLPPILATTVLTPWQHRDDVNGMIVVGPGTAISLQATAGAGATPVMAAALLWAEIPL